MKLIIAGYNLLAFTEPKPAPIETITVKNRDAFDLAVLMDAHSVACKAGRGRSEKIAFWMAVKKMYPQTEKGTWDATSDRLSVELTREA